jgi:hypothetical protein
VDSFLRQQERKALAGDIDALWQAYYALKRTIPALSNKSLRDLASSCSEELYQQRSCEFWWGSSERATNSVEIPQDGSSIKQLALDYLQKYEHLRSWYQATPDGYHGYVRWTPESKLLFYRSTRYGDRVRPVAEYLVSEDEVPEARCVYLIWLVG